MKKCSKCKEIKNLTDFYKDRASPNGVKSRCKMCKSADKKEALQIYRQNNPAKIFKKYSNSKERRRTNVCEKYGITLFRYEKMLKEQNNTCAICKEPETMKKKNGTLQNLAIDHCHKTGIVRGLLCSKCNTGIGYFKENRNILKNAITYLENKKVPEPIEES